MAEQAIYVAGGRYGVGKNKKFKLVHATHDPRPYLTKNPNGLLTTKHHASLYEILPGSIQIPPYTQVKLIDRRCDLNHENPECAILTDLQIKAVREAIKDEYYFD